MKALALSLATIASAAQAQQPMSGAEFDAYTRGQTLSYLENGVPYGAEQYLDGRRVIWAFEGDICIRGRWDEPEPGLICFYYDHPDATPQCWNFFIEEDGLQAVFAGEDGRTTLYALRRSPAPLFCPGPKVGA